MAAAGQEQEAVSSRRGNGTREPRWKVCEACASAKAKRKLQKAELRAALKDEKAKRKAAAARFAQKLESETSTLKAMLYLAQQKNLDDATYIRGLQQRLEAAGQAAAPAAGLAGHKRPRPGSGSQ